MTVETEDQEQGEAELRRKLVMKRLETLMQSNPQLYYEPTSTVARTLCEDIKNDDNLGDAGSAAVSGLTARDIEIILAFR